MALQRSLIELKRWISKRNIFIFPSRSATGDCSDLLTVPVSFPLLSSPICHGHISMNFYKVPTSSNYCHIREESTHLSILQSSHYSHSVTEREVEDIKTIMHLLPSVVQVLVLAKYRNRYDSRISM